jgi:hypothetical protein
MAGPDRWDLGFLVGRRSPTMPIKPTILRTVPDGPGSLVPPYDSNAE